MSKPYALAEPPVSVENGIVGRSAALRDVLSRVDDASHTRPPVLITGESGTGKELVARALHYRGPRKGHPFVAIHLSALPENTQETELFGHVTGSFTGALRDKIGLIEEADGGTVFLDEVAELSATTQLQLLRFLTGGEFRRVGSMATIHVEVRVVSASQRNLEDEVSAGRFRRDLLEALSVITIHLPPLRERPDDIDLLARHLIEKNARAQGKAPPDISDRALSLLRKYEWRGNIRELGLIMERALAFDRDGVITSDDLPPRLRERKEDRFIAEAQRRRLTLDELEREYILATLEECAGSRKETASRLGVTPVTLWRKLKRCRAAD